MGTHAKEIRGSWRKALTAAGIAVLAVPVFPGLMTGPRLHAQAPTPQSLAVPQWQINAGGKMAFDVASIKLNKSSDPARTNVNLSGLDDSSPKSGGLFSTVNFPLNVYIGFAFKLSGNQMRYLQPQLPKWATMERFDVQARAEGNPTRDQMRLMMQSLLADRFKLVVHFETKQLPVFALVLEKPGKIGPYLTAHTDDPPCASQPTPGSTPATPAKDDIWFLLCGAISAQSVSGHMRVGSRNLTMGEIASHLVAASMGALQRPVLDQTGLSGIFDFRIEFMPEFKGPPPSGFQPDESGPTFLEALREQLGLKLIPQTGLVDVLVADHIEEPSPN